MPVLTLNWLSCLILALTFWLPRVQEDQPPAVPEQFRRDQLVTWCIVPFDSEKRSPEERAAMCAELGLKRIAYDWRQEHVREFEAEIRAYRKHGLEYYAFWGVHDEAFRLFQEYELHPQIWWMAGDVAGDTDEERVQDVVNRIMPVILRAREIGSRVGLYNHGGWSGEPENMVRVMQALEKEGYGENAGIVYNLHHGHSHLERLDEALSLMKPWLLCLNVNGMDPAGDQRGRKILPVGAGQLDPLWLKTIRDSEYDGPIGIIGHTQDNVRERLLDNLEGLEWLLRQPDAKIPRPRPRYRTWSDVSADAASQSSTSPLQDAVISPADRRLADGPLTAECRFQLTSARSYNILLAHEEKASGTHWELFTTPGNGFLHVYTPGRHPDHLRTSICVSDQRPHTARFIMKGDELSLAVDGRVVAQHSAPRIADRRRIPGGMAAGRLVEGGLGCDGVILSAHVVAAAIRVPESLSSNAETTVVRWQAEAAANINHTIHHSKKTLSHHRPEEVAARVRVGNTPNPVELSQWVKKASLGDPNRGLAVFAAAEQACLSCHRIGSTGGQTGPALTELAAKRTAETIVRSVLWPDAEVDPAYRLEILVDTRGKIHKGYLLAESKKSITLKDPTRPEAAPLSIDIDELEERSYGGTLMPGNLAASLTETQLQDLLAFLLQAGHPADAVISTAEAEMTLHHLTAHASGPMTFRPTQAPLQPATRPYHREEVNRDRIYDFYTKQAVHFAAELGPAPRPPALLSPYPGLDGGQQGHWGNQNEATWAADAWATSRLPSVQAGVFRGNGATVPRAACVRLDSTAGLACCFDTDTCRYKAVWHGGFLEISTVRHGFMGGLKPAGAILPWTDSTSGETAVYRGLYQGAGAVHFLYELGGRFVLNSPHVVNGTLQPRIREFATLEEARGAVELQETRPPTFRTKVTPGQHRPWTVDTIHLPPEEQLDVPLFPGGLGFSNDGTAWIGTMQGEVWRVTLPAPEGSEAVWERFATGLHQCLGLEVDDTGLYVLGRDQITRLHDQNDDGVADYYECYSRAYTTSPSGHDYICGLERDAHGRFYTASGNQGVVRISADGRTAEVLATGFRNPDGLGLFPDGTVTVPCSEGTWTPASMICGFPADRASEGNAPWFGYPGSVNSPVPQLPLVYLPRGLDNSAGGQVPIPEGIWPDLGGCAVHLSFGTGRPFLLLRDEVNGQLQGAVVPLPCEFASGSHRGEFNPSDGELYVVGMQGWGSYTPENGCFQRLRRQSDLSNVPIHIETWRNGILLQFAAPVDQQSLADLSQIFAQQWNYRYSAAYGSPEYSVRHFGTPGHDVVSVRGVHFPSDNRTVFIELDSVSPVNQLHLHLNPGSAAVDVFATIHDVRQELFPGIPQREKSISVPVEPHPIHRDMALTRNAVPNPLARPIPDARPVMLETADNLSFSVRELTVRSGEPIALTLRNPDVVPHNWALVRPGSLETVGQAANQLIADPDAVFRQYVPRSDDVLAYTDIVAPGTEFTIWMTAPEEPGDYPYLCTFPGHWRVMNGILRVLPRDTPSDR